MTTCYTDFDSPLGCITLQCNNEGLQGCWFETQTSQPDQLGTRHSDNPILIQARRELEEYFSGSRTRFSVRLAPQGTAFQQRVWHALTTIEFGQTCTYQDLAGQIGQPMAARAVGAANGRNPISVIVPCHRVIGRSGKLTGYAGGLQRKQWLLSHERASASPTQR